MLRCKNNDNITFWFDRKSCKNKLHLSLLELWLEIESVQDGFRGAFLTTSLVSGNLWTHISFLNTLMHFRFGALILPYNIDQISNTLLIWKCDIVVCKFHYYLYINVNITSRIMALPSSEYQLFWLRNLVLNAKQIFLDRHSLHAMNSSMKNKTIHQSYLSCHHCVLYCKQTWNVKLQYIHISYVSCSTPIIVNCMFRAPWLEENKRKWTWNYYWIAH